MYNKIPAIIVALSLVSASLLIAGLLPDVTGVSVVDRDPQLSLEIQAPLGGSSVVQPGGGGSGTVNSNSSVTYASGTTQSFSIVDVRSNLFLGTSPNPLTGTRRISFTNALPVGPSDSVVRAVSNGTLVPIPVTSSGVSVPYQWTMPILWADTTVGSSNDLIWVNGNNLHNLNTSDSDDIWVGFNCTATNVNTGYSWAFATWPVGYTAVTNVQFQMMASQTTNWPSVIRFYDKVSGSNYTVTAQLATAGTTQTVSFVPPAWMSTGMVGRQLGARWTQVGGSTSVTTTAWWLLNRGYGFRIQQ